MPQRFRLGGVTTSALDNDYDIQITMRCFGGVMNISYSLQNIKSDGLRNQYLDNWHALETDDGAQWDRTTKQLVEPFQSIMTDLAGKLPVPPSDLLSDYLYPKHYAFEARAAAGDEKVAPFFIGETPKEDMVPPGQYIPQISGQLQQLFELGSWVSSIYSSRQTRIIPSFSTRAGEPRLARPARVLAGGHEYFFKPWHGGNGPGSANLSELATYRRIAESTAAGRIRSDLRICRMHGVVVDDDEDTWPVSEEGGSRLLGILLTWVETNQKPWLETLYHRASSTVATPDVLSSWSDQLDTLIAEIHRVDIVWGDAKPHNILVDRSGFIWLIDFGGSYTDGWVDRKNKGTKEGDSQGVERIKAFLSKRATTS
ncbi:Uu.00g077750.m01.CDS01 [Anthostomella pinea]|uniref:Uu.00g077750.m01.CDS01 n=1 Tax=Anthostomella pinea TaxID=933095 RepID=A0AAI8VKH0_9PEZI|nr:Uu.00g077750.m01.CDS01 [Anthostomella pinea]